MVLVNDPDGRVVHFLDAALRLRDDCKREGIDNQSQKHEIAHEAAQLFGPQPEYVGKRPQPSQLSCLRSSNRLSVSSAGMKRARVPILAARSVKPRPLVKVPTLTGRK